MLPGLEVLENAYVRALIEPKDRIDTEIEFITRDLYFVGIRHGGAAVLTETMKTHFDSRYAMTASAKALRRGLKTKLLGDLLSKP